MDIEGLPLKASGGRLFYKGKERKRKEKKGKERKRKEKKRKERKRDDIGKTGN